MSLFTGVHREADGSLTIIEAVGFDIARRTEQEVQDILRECAEAESKGGRPQKHLVVKIAAIHEGVTLNGTEYRRDELVNSIPSWTSPYAKPMITDHNEWEVDRIVGRIVAANEIEHNGTKALEFTAHITSPTAVEKIRDGLWQTVSIGVRVSSATCSICGNDWAKGTWCEHERGMYYVKDEDQETGKSTMCTWILGGLAGKECSFVTTPADQNAMIVAMEDGKTGSAKASKAEAYVLSSDELIAISESLGVRRTDSSGASGAVITEMLHSIESAVTEDKETNVENEDVTPVEEPEAPAAGAEADAEAVNDAAASTSNAPEEPEDGTDAEDGSAEGAGSDDAGEDAADGNAADGSDEGASDGEAESASDADGADDAGEGDAEGADADGDAAEAESTERELRNCYAVIYVERATASGILSGDHDGLVDEYAERSLDDLRVLVTEQTRLGGYNPRRLESMRGIVGDETAVAGTDADESANADYEDEGSEVVYEVEIGEGETIVIAADEIEQVTMSDFEPVIE